MNDMLQRLAQLGSRALAAFGVAWIAKFGFDVDEETTLQITSASDMILGGLAAVVGIVIDMWMHRRKTGGALKMAGTGTGTET